jgi:hypothetical protein
MHTQELEMDDPRLGPIVKFQKISGQNPRPIDFRKIFSMVIDKDGDDQLSEVSEGIYPSEVYIKSTGET